MLFFSYYERLKQLKEAEFQQEPTEDVAADKGRGRSLAYDLALEWFQGLIKNADHMPNCRTQTLPSCLTKSAVYNIYCEQISGKPSARSTFLYNIWRKQFPNVIIPKVSM